MDSETLYERWRISRSQVEPSGQLADRVVESIGSPIPTTEPPARVRPISRVMRAGVCAAALLAALFRVAELLNLFAASRIEN